MSQVMKIFRERGECDGVICTWGKFICKKNDEKNELFLAGKKKVVFLCRK